MQSWLELTYKLYANSNVSCMRDVRGPGRTDLIVQKRCSLKNETIQEIMCLKGWWKSGFGGPITITE